MDTIYVEREVIDHPRVLTIAKRFPNAELIAIERHGEVFNRKAQNFRVQKKNPSLILASKRNKKVLPSPVQYETGGGANYYFSHMLNCLYDCRYCFLQGMYRSANYLLFVNYEDFVADIRGLAETHVDDDNPVWFFSGYDCDSLAFEPISKFAEHFVPEFSSFPNSVLELRTKSTQIRALLDQKPLENVVVAYSLSPDNIANAIELGAPSLGKRLQALKRLQQQGWRIGVRFDPMIWHNHYQFSYSALVKQTFTSLDSSAIDSITVGGFRLPRGFYKIMRRLHPEHWLFSAGLTENDGMIAYTKAIESEMFKFMQASIEPYVDSDKIFTYPSYAGEHNR